MAVVQLPDDLQRVIDRQVAEGRAADPAAFLEDAVMRLIDATSAEEDDLRRTVQASTADLEAGRFTTVATPNDETRLRDSVLARLRSRGATNE